MILFTVHALFGLVIGALRMRELSRGMSAGVPAFSRLHLRVTMVGCAACALLPLVRMLGLFVQGRSNVAEVLSDSLQAIAWVLAFLVVSYEWERGEARGSWLSWWFVGAYFAGAARLQSLFSSDFRSLEFYVAALLFLSYAVLSVQALFFNERARGASQGPAYERLAELSKALQTTTATVVEEGGGADEGRRGPETRASVFSRLTFAWISPLMALGFARPLEERDLPALSEGDCAADNAVRFGKRWREERARGREGASLVRALWRAYGGYFARTGLLKLAQDAAMFLGPMLLQYLIRFVADSGAPLWQGLVFSAALLVSSTLQTFCVHAYFFRVFRSGLRIRAGLVTEIYAKAFALSSAARQAQSLGEITNHMSIDAQRLSDLTTYLHMIWSGPEQIAVCLWMLWGVLGPAVLAGLGLMLLLIPVNTMLARRLGALQKELLANKDRRVKALAEALSGVRILKFFAWERHFQERIEETRAAELATMRRAAGLRAVTLFFWSATPLLVALSTFTAFVLSGHALTAEAVFTALTLFNILRFPLAMVPQVISSLVEARASASRIQAYLLADELDPDSAERRPRPDDAPYAIELDRATFTWAAARPGDSSVPTLREISLRIPHGALVGLVGAVGSGKSSRTSVIARNSQQQQQQHYYNYDYGQHSHHLFIVVVAAIIIIVTVVVISVPMEVLRYVSDLGAAGADAAAGGPRSSRGLCRILRAAGLDAEC